VNASSNRSFFSNPFSRWEQDGITKEMVNCCGVQLIAKKAVYRKKVALLEISQNGKRVDIQIFSTKYKPEVHDVINFRMEAMKRGVIMAINYARVALGVTKFPYVYALLYPLDDAEILRRVSSRCHCSIKSATIRRRSDYLPCSSTKLNAGGMNNCNVITSWPPFLAQNRKIHPIIYSYSHQTSHTFQHLITVGIMVIEMIFGSKLSKRKLISNPCPVQIHRISQQNLV